MAKIARPAQETPECIETIIVLLHALIEKINHKFVFIVIFSNIETQQRKTTPTCKYDFTVELKVLPIAGNQGNSCTIDHIVWWTTFPLLHLHIYKKKYMYFFSSLYMAK